jgi:NitT/TauT family transport system substrate-binding protein
MTTSGRFQSLLPPGRLTRRQALRAGGLGLTGAGAALLFGCGDDGDEADLFEGPPEVTSLRIAKPPPVCMVAQYLAEEHLRQAGFTEVEYVPISLPSQIAPSTASGAVDFTLNFAPYNLVSIDRGEDVVVLAGIHVGCWEVFAVDPEIRTMADLKGKTIAVPDPPTLDSAGYVFMASFLAYVGIDVARDVTFKVVPFAETAAALEAGEVDAFPSFPPMTLAVHDRGTTHVILDGIRDEPYSHYFCCMLNANAEFVRKYPVATSRVLEAYIKAAEHCAREPEAVADFLVEKHGMSEEHARAMMRSLPYDVWRRFDPEDTMTFYALRLREAGIISSSPEDIVARGTDWSHLNRLKEKTAALPFGFGGANPFYCDLYASSFLGPFERLASEVQS